MSEREITELFVVGNGFDLQCGLGTTYYNFLSYVLTNHFKENFEQKLIDSDKPVVEQYETRLRDYLNIAEDVGTYQVHRNYPDFKEVNIWYLIFLFEKSKGLKNWASVEEIMTNYLKDYQIIDFISHTIADAVSAEKIGTNLEKYAELGLSRTPYSERSFILKFITYSILHKDVSSMPQNDMYKKMQECYSTKANVDIDRIKELVTTILMLELNELEYDFECFIKCQVEKNASYLAKSNDLLKRMLNPESDSITPVESRPYYLLSFNYTSIWSESCKPKYSPTKYADIHGKVPKSSIRLSNIIFGIDHEGVDATALEYRFTKTYRTLQLYSRNFEDVANDREIYIDTIKQIKFYGHSLAEADYAYFQQMFDYYELYGNQNLELIFYYSVYEGSEPERIQQEQMLNISRLIEKYGQTLDNKNHGKNLLTRLIQTNRLKLICI